MIFFFIYEKEGEKSVFPPRGYCHHRSRSPEPPVLLCDLPHDLPDVSYEADPGPPAGRQVPAPVRVLGEGGAARGPEQHVHLRVPHAAVQVEHQRPVRMRKFFF